MSPDATPAEKAILVYKHAMLIECYAVGVALVFSVIFGYLYEAWSRKAVLIMSFELLGVSMILPKMGV